MEIAMIRKLQEQRGAIALRLSIVFLVATLLFLVVFNVRHVYQVTDLVIERTNEAVLAVAAFNGPGSLGGIRDGEAAARIYTGSDWERVVTSEDVRYTLARSLGATMNGQSLIRADSYRIDHLATSYINADGENLQFVTTMDLTIPLMGLGVLPITRPLEVKTTYEARF